MLLHGYGGFGSCFYRLIAQLHDSYKVITIDLPGMALSSKPKQNPFDSTETAINYFVSKIAVFIEKLKLDNFILVGHSIGAFIAAHVYASIQQKVNHLFLLSPAGFNEATEEIVAQQ